MMATLAVPQSVLPSAAFVVTLNYSPRRQSKIKSCNPVYESVCKHIRRPIGIIQAFRIFESLIFYSRLGKMIACLSSHS